MGVKRHNAYRPPSAKGQTPFFHDQSRKAPAASGACPRLTDVQVAPAGGHTQRPSGKTREERSWSQPEKSGQRSGEPDRGSFLPDPGPLPPGPFPAVASCLNGCKTGWPSSSVPVN
jgi:hypothetical protein